jgi:integrase
MGYLYRPKLKRRPGETEARESSVWWCKYYANGRPVRESTGIKGDSDTPPKAAERFLKIKEGRAASGEAMLPRTDRIRYEEIRKDLLEHYATTGRRNAVELGWRLKHLDRFFGGRRVVDITDATVTSYVARRQEQGASNGTINRELATIGPMMRLAYRHRKATRLPLIERLKENAKRAGFFEEDQYKAVVRHLPADLQVVAAIAYRFAWRARSEILTLERRHLDLEQGTLTLDPGMTKNDDGRKVYLTPDLKSLLAAQLGRVDALQKRLGKIIPYLFPHLGGKQPGKRAGTPRTAFYKVWRTACRKAGVPGMLTHDFRRTAVRNLEISAVPRSFAMKLTGHRTEAVYRRYAIVSDADLRAASAKLAGTFSGTSTLLLSYPAV